MTQPCMCGVDLENIAIQEKKKKKKIIIIASRPTPNSSCFSVKCHFASELYYYMIEFLLDNEYLRDNCYCSKALFLFFADQVHSPSLCV